MPGQTDRQTDRQRDRQADRSTDRQADIQTSRQADRQTDRQTEGEQDGFSYPCLAGISAECTFQICLSCHSSESEHFQKPLTKDSPCGQVINSNKNKT